jgi:hypothetical protein
MSSSLIVLKRASVVKLCRTGDSGKIEFSRRLSYYSQFKCPDKGILTKPISLLLLVCRSHEPLHSMARTIIRALKFSDEIVSCYKDPARLVLFHDVEMNGHIREESVSFRNQFRHQLTRLCV